MGLFIANKAIFLHLHKLNNGTIIEHAHPFDKSNDSKPYKSHDHSNAEFLLFQNLETFFLIVFLTLVLITLVKKEKVSFKLITEHTLTCINLCKGRAPPIS
jgi:hypothetical protein